MKGFKVDHREVVVMIKAAFFSNHNLNRKGESVKQEETFWEQMNHLHVVATPWVA